MTSMSMVSPQGIILVFPDIVHENEDDIGAVILGIAVKNCIVGMWERSFTIPLDGIAQQGTISHQISS